MEVVKYQIVAFKLPSGRRPFMEWLNSLDPSVQDLMELRFQRIKLGNLGDTKYLGNGIFELRFHIRSGYRIYYGKDRQLIVFLRGGNKNTQTKDIKYAKRYWFNYVRGKSNAS